MALPLIGRIRQRPQLLEKDELLQRAVKVVRDPKLLDLEPRGTRDQVEQVSKALQYGAGSATARSPFGAMNAKPTPAAVVAARAHQALGPSSSITPVDIALAMQAQGLDWVEPFAPGQPLTPYYGYGRQPRTRDYKVGRNVTTQAREGRIPFHTLDQLFKSYDVAQIATRHAINSLRSMEVRFQALDGWTKSPKKEIVEARKRLRRPDGEHSFKNWLAENMFSLYRFDSAPIYRNKDRAGNITKLINISAPTIGPMLDYYGNLPEGLAPAFQQYIQGVPWDWLTRDDIIYEPFWPEAESPYGTPPLETILMNANCYSADTEVLTNRGWLRFADVDIAKDKFATRNPETARFEWQSATKYYEADSDGTMYHAASKNVDVLVTGGHRMLVDRLPKGCPGVKHGNEWLVHAEDLYEYQSALSEGGAAVRCPATSAWDAPDLEWFSLPMTAADLVRLDGAVARAARGARSINSVAAQAGVSRPTLHRAETGERLRRSCAEAICTVYGLPLSVIQEDSHYFSEGIEGDDFAAFMGMYLSEGCVRSDGSNITIAQEEYSKGYVEFRDLLARMLGREAPYHRGAFTFGHTALADYLRPFGKAHEKYVPREVLDMSRRQLEIFWRFYVLGDGAIYPRTEIVTTVSKHMADGLQEVLQKIGYSASVRPVGTPAKPTHHQRWQVQTRLKEAYRVDVERVAYEGKVYCVSVPNKTLYVRRNGYPTWCANTDLRLQLYFMQFFTAGAVPEAFAIAPADMSVGTDIAEFEEQYGDYLYGDQSERYGLHWLPNGTELEFYKPQMFDPDLAEYVLSRTAAAFMMNAHDIGFTSDVNRSSGATQADLTDRVGDLPVKGYYEDILDSVIQEDWGLPVQIKFVPGGNEEDTLDRAQAFYFYWQMGAISSTEVREELGYTVDPEEKMPLGILDPRIGWIPAAHIISVSGDIDPRTGMPKAGTITPQDYLLPSGNTPAPIAGPQPPAQIAPPAPGGQPAPAAGAGPKAEPSKATPKAPRASSNVASKEQTPDEPNDETQPYPNGQPFPEIGSGRADGFPGYGTFRGGSTAQGTAAGANEGDQLVYEIERADPKHTTYASPVEQPSYYPRQRLVKEGPTAGITAASGIAGVDGGHRDGDEDDERADLIRWQKLARKAVAKGSSPRHFTSSSIRPHVYAAAWAGLEKATTPDQMRAAIDTALKVAAEPCAGVLVRAKDSGRVLLLQRALQEV